MPKNRPDVVQLAKLGYNRREVCGQIIADQHLDIVRGKCLDIGEEDLRKYFYL
jgi:hypothetical protein